MTRSTPLITPFPHVPQTRKKKYALEDAVRRLHLVDWPVTVEDGARRVSSDAQRAILQVVADHSDAAGRSFLSVGTIVRESGWAERTVWRAISALEDQGLLERVPLLRRSARYPRDLPRHARQGQGPNVYRVGATLRASAGLVELDWSPEEGGWVRAPQKRTVADPASEPLAAPDRATSVVAGPAAEPERAEPRGTPREEGVADPGVQGNQPEEPAPRGTPITKNGRALSKERLVLSRSEGTNRPREQPPAGAELVGLSVRCSRHGRETRIESVAAGIAYLACGCFLHGNEAP